jgi:hypothetical protein
VDVVPQAQRQEQHSVARLCYYHSVPELRSSDHKPVVAGFEVQLPGVCGGQEQQQLPAGEARHSESEAHNSWQPAAAQPWQQAGAAVQLEAPHLSGILPQQAEQQGRQREGRQEGQGEAGPPEARRPLVKVAIAPPAAARAVPAGAKARQRALCVLQ